MKFALHVLGMLAGLILLPYADAGMAWFSGVQGMSYVLHWCPTLAERMLHGMVAIVPPCLLTLGSGGGG